MPAYAGQHFPVFLNSRAGNRPTLPTFRYVSGVSSSGRYMVDQVGSPILIRGDSPWSMMSDLVASDVDTYLAAKRTLGINALILSAVGSTQNGGPADTGATFDGILPFNSGDITSLNSTYWARVDTFLGKIRDAGMTAFLYPIDGWNTLTGCVFDGKSTANCQTYGQLISARYSGYPIVWMFGGDFASTGGSIDQQMGACLTGIRSTGDTRPCSLQGSALRSLTSDQTYWNGTRADMNFVYTYYVTYEGVLAGYNATWDTTGGKPATRPAFFGEGEYDGSSVGDAGSPLTVRKQVGWTMTSGGAGSFTGQENVWNFNTGWQSNISNTQSQHSSAMLSAISGMKWWQFVPDSGSALVTAGRGTSTSGAYNSTNSYVTAAKTADGTQALIYLPDASSAITVSWSTMAANNRQATWIDPTSGATAAGTGGATSYSRTANAAGGSDWLLKLTAE